jgi:hypothetical protein
MRHHSRGIGTKLRRWSDLLAVTLNAHETSLAAIEVGLSLASFG